MVLIGIKCMVYLHCCVPGKAFQGVCVSCYQAKPSFCKHKDSFICAPVEFCPSTVDKNTDNLCQTSREKVLLVKELRLNNVKNILMIF